ncbi:M-phase inducer phosphatase 1-like [Mytilus trossulus]|uniref:M-phase inducer phosphatase 1-like n=1 Tax=Mytilus trossulus TaxID=6551 RepID=UPI003007294A
MSVLCELPSRAMDYEEDDITDLISPPDFLQKDKNDSFYRKTKRSPFMSNLGSPSRLHPVKRFKQSLSFGDMICDQIIEPEIVVNDISGDNDMIGDGSRRYALRAMTGKNPDLKTISHDTMSSVINGSYDDVISRYRIIDCRYPYEYEGGHIKNAENIYTKNGIIEFLEDNCDVTKRQVLIFHCEFSSERGPKLCRFLRNIDRQRNSYPLLTFPEMYILEGGYKQFYQNHKELCEPVDYVPMLHKDHVDDIKRFRSKSKSWTAGEKKKIPFCLYS